MHLGLLELELLQRREGHMTQGRGLAKGFGGLDSQGLGSRV